MREPILTWFALTQMTDRNRSELSSEPSALAEARKLGCDFHSREVNYERHNAFDACCGRPAGSHGGARVQYFGSGPGGPREVCASVCRSMERSDASRWRVPLAAAVGERPNAMLIIRDARNHGKLLVMAQGKGSASHQSALTIVKRNGRRYVSSLALASIETTFVYSVPKRPKPERPELEASVQSIPVQLAGS